MNLRYPSGKKGHSLTAILAVALLVGGFYGVGLYTSPVATGSCAPGYQSIPTFSSTSGQVNASQNVCARLTVSIDKQGDTYANPQMLAEGFNASCYTNCHGILYILDPTVLITVSGHDFEQYKVFGTAGSITGTSTDSAAYIGLSESNSGPTASDYSAAGPCKTTSPNNELTTGGLANALGAVVAGVASTTVTTTISHTFTAAETDNTVQAACLQTELATSANPIIYAEGTFGPDSLVSGNTISVQWSIART